MIASKFKVNNTASKRTEENKVHSNMEEEKMEKVNLEQLNADPKQKNNETNNQEEEKDMEANYPFLENKDCEFIVFNMMGIKIFQGDCEPMVLFIDDHDIEWEVSSEFKRNLIKEFQDFLKSNVDEEMIPLIDAIEFLSSSDPNPY